MDFDGGANHLTGESVSFGESRVRVIGLVLEQKGTKETENSEGNRVAIRFGGRIDQALNPNTIENQLPNTRLNRLHSEGLVIG